MSYIQKVFLFGSIVGRVILFKVKSRNIYIIVWFFFLISTWCVGVVWADPNSTDYIYINGGYTASSNYDYNEKNILSFNRNWFDQKAVIFNASGRDAKVVVVNPNQSLQRDQQGRLVVHQTWVKGTAENPIQEALKEKILDALKNSQKKNLTIVMGDHGGLEGVRLWNDSLSYSEFQQALRANPNAPLVRSIQMHCYGARMLAPLRVRTWPDGARQRQKLLISRYPKNFCGLSLGSDSEVIYYPPDKKPGQSYWDDYLSSEKKPSLEKFKKFLDQDKQWVMSTPYLTSDLFVQDLYEMNCNSSSRHERISSCVDRSKEQNTSDKSIEFTSEFSSKMFCVMGGIEKDQKLKQQIIDLDHLTDAFESLSSVLMLGYIRENWKRLIPNPRTDFQSYVSLLSEIESLYRQMAREPIASERMEMLAKMVADKKRQLPIEYDLLRGAEASSPEFIQYADRNFDEILRSRFVELLPYKQKNFKLTQASLYHQLAAKQIERKVGALELQANRKEFLKSYFSHPEHQDLKRRYEEIVACEKSDLR